MDNRPLPSNLYTSPNKSIIKSALDKLVSNGLVRLSERNRRFLVFVVHETLEGRADRIKAYTIGADVFGRGEDFDPNNDPIVRIEATRLRAALAAYYSGPGSRDAVRIVMRPGSYIPTFEAPASASSPPFLANHPRKPAECHEANEAACTVVIAYLTDPRDRDGAARSALLVNALAKKLLAFGFKVFLLPGTQQKISDRRLLTATRACGKAFLLDIGVHDIADGRRYSWSVCALGTGEVHALDSVDLMNENTPDAHMIDEFAKGALNALLARLT